MLVTHRGRAALQRGVLAAFFTPVNLGIRTDGMYATSNAVAEKAGILRSLSHHYQSLGCDLAVVSIVFFAFDSVRIAKSSCAISRARRVFHLKKAC